MHKLQNAHRERILGNRREVRALLLSVPLPATPPAAEQKADLRLVPDA